MIAALEKRGFPTGGLRSKVGPLNAEWEFWKDLLLVIQSNRSNA